MEKQRIQNNQEEVVEKELGGLVLADSKTYYKAIVFKECRIN